MWTPCMCVCMCERKSLCAADVLCSVLLPSLAGLCYCSLVQTGLATCFSVCKHKPHLFHCNLSTAATKSCLLNTHSLTGSASCLMTLLYSRILTMLFSLPPSYTLCICLWLYYEQENWATHCWWSMSHFFISWELQFFSRKVFFFPICPYWDMSALLPRNTQKTWTRIFQVRGKPSRGQGLLKTTALMMEKSKLWISNFWIKVKIT